MFKSHRRLLETLASDSVHHLNTDFRHLSFLQNVVKSWLFWARQTFHQAIGVQAHLFLVSYAWDFFCYLVKHKRKNSRLIHNLKLDIF